MARNLYLSSSPRVVGDRRADFYSLEAFLASPGFAGKSGEALALAIYNYFTSGNDGTYHFWPSDEQRGNPRIRSRVEDPVKLINAYGWMICGQVASLLQGLYEAAGMRCRGLAGVPGHSLCEVHYEGRWHLLDVDMWTWFRTPAGHLASAFELASNPQALVAENKEHCEPLCMPDRALPGYVQMYANIERGEDDLREFRPRWATRAHTMDFRLRPGETLIRSQTHQGRFPYPDSFSEPRKTYPKEWVGFPRERYEPFRTFGNGQWIYEPDLTSASADFAEAVWERKGLTQDADGLIGPGEVTIRIQSPYPFVSKPAVDAKPVTFSDGAFLELSGSGKLHAFVNSPEGEWVNVFGPAEDEGKISARVDISEQTEARYDCVLQLTLDEGARLNRLKFESFIMTAPGSLPRLAEGGNTMMLRTLDAHGEPTVPWTSSIDFRSEKDLLGQAAAMENAVVAPYVPGWQCLAPREAGKPVKAVYRFDAPAGREFAWAYVLCTVREAPVGQSGNTATLEWSFDGQAWNPLSGITIPSTTLQWDASISGQVVPGANLRAPTLGKALWIRITSDTAIAALEFTGHLLENTGLRDPLEITHRWTDAAGQQSFTAPAGARSYSVTCGKDPKVHTIEMRVPSRKA